MPAMKAVALVLAFILGAVIGLLAPTLTPAVQLQLMKLPWLMQSQSTAGLAACLDVYKGFPLSPAYSASDIEPSAQAPPGLAHVTVAGAVPLGLRRVEMWMETLAPGKGTPIHTHDCEEVFLLLSGAGTMTIQAKDGSLHQQPLSANSTISILPNARHQFVNTGEGDLQFVVAFDSPPLRPVMYGGWDAAPGEGKPMFPLFWDRDCPSRYPSTIDVAALATGVSAKAEL